MGNPQVAEALFRAWVDRQTGWLTCTSQGRETKIPLREGSVVGTSLGAGFGWQGTVPALLQNGRLGLSQLDALWARGEAAAHDSDTLDELGIVPADAESARVLASIRETVRAADAVRFEAGDVGSGDLVSGARVVREAWSAISSVSDEPAFFRAQDLNGLAQWEPSRDDENWLQDYLEWKQPESANPAQLALLALLTKTGAFESVPAVEMRRRVEEERLERERLEQERIEAERLEQERREAERLEQERIAAEKAEAERLEQERIAAEKAEAERIEQERIAAEKAEAERLEQERIAAEKAEAERLEQERTAAEKAEAERIEQK
ncbi:MAG: molecular chaperone DnaJ, partial [Archangium sp.]